MRFGWKVIVLLMILFNSFGGFVNVASAAPPAGQSNVLAGLTFNVGPDIKTSSKSLPLLTDGVPNTPNYRLMKAEYAWVSLPKPTKVLGFRFWASGGAYSITLSFYDSSGALLRSIPTNSVGLITGDLQTVSIENVSKIAIKHSLDDSYGVYVSELELYKGDDIPPGEVTSLSSVFLPGDKVQASWVNPTDADFTKVEIYEGSTLVATVSTPDNKYLFEKVYSEKTYTFKTVDGSGNKSSGVSLVVKPPPPKPTVELTLEHVSHDRVVLRPKGIVDYFELYRDGELIKTLPSVTTSYADYGVKAETAYSYVLKGYNESGSSEVALKVTTLAVPPPDPPGPPPDPLPEPPPFKPTPLPEVDTGNEDLDGVTKDMLEGGAIMKNGGMILIFWAIAIAVILLGARWLWSLFKSWMAKASGTGTSGSSGGGNSSGGSSGGGGQRSSGSGRKGGSGSDSRSERVYTHNGKEYKVYEGSYDSRDRVSKSLERFQ